MEGGLTGPDECHPIDFAWAMSRNGSLYLSYNFIGRKIVQAIINHGGTSPKLAVHAIPITGLEWDGVNAQ